MNKLNSLLEIAQVHAKRLNYAILRIAPIIPIQTQVIESLSDENMLIFELYMSRFTKLQDFMGSTLFPAILEKAQEFEQSMTLLDQLHKLEKMNLIISADHWVLMRKTRNRLTHEYPNNPELAARFFNDAYGMAEELLKNLDLIIQFIHDKQL